MSSGKIFETQDGSHSILSAEYGVSYHSRYGAIQESKHVFIDAGLRRQAVGRTELSILEVGFGAGLNAFLSLLEADRQKIKLYYETIESHPISLEEAGQLNYAVQSGAPAGYGDYFQQLHLSAWETVHQVTPYFHFQKKRVRLESYSSPPLFQVIFFDAFAPNAQPELWEEEIFARMYEALSPNGILVTYCAKGVVKRRMRAVGFTVEALPGPPGKREMTRGVKPAQ